jgi:uncharacterized membrane protein
MNPPDPSHPVLVHFYRALVGHMDVWRQRMDATTNWAAATTAVMVTFSFGSADSPHFVLLLAIGFNGTFLLMESRRYQIFDLWRRRFRALNRHLIAPVLSGEDPEQPDDPARREALAQVATDLGRMVPHLSLLPALGYRMRRNYGYLFMVVLLAWLLKLHVHPVPAHDPATLVARAGIGAVPGVIVIAIVAAAMLCAVIVAIRAPSEQMLNWADVPSPYQRWISGRRERGGDV